jgi:rubrerythrin
MPEFPGPDVPLVPGFSGLPVHTEPTSPGPQPGSVEWLLDAIERHSAAEADALGQYEYVSKASGDPVVALVMRLILEDEERHHGLLKRMEATLRDALDWTNSPNALPSSGVPRAPVGQDLAEAVRALIDDENTGARYMRELARQEERVGADLHALLLEMMALDSEKHAKLLGFVRDRLAARPRTDEGSSI